MPAKDLKVGDNVMVAGGGANRLKSVDVKLEPVRVLNPEGPCTQYLGTWVLGNSNYSTGFG